jgi:hypothetical protein
MGSVGFDGLEEFISEKLGSLIDALLGHLLALELGLGT